MSLSCCQFLKSLMVEAIGSAEMTLSGEERAGLLGVLLEPVRRLLNHPPEGVPSEIDLADAQACSHWLQHLEVSMSHRMLMTNAMRLLILMLPCRGTLPSLCTKERTERLRPWSMQ